MSVVTLKSKNDSIECQYSLGEVVVLKSGGPAMTIREIYPPKNGSPMMIETDWFDESEHWSGEFFIHQILAYPESEE